MKNLAISILAAIQISGMEFWEYSKSDDRFWIAFALTLILFVNIYAIESWVKDRRMKKFRTKRFGRMVDEMQNRP